MWGYCCDVDIIDRYKRHGKVLYKARCEPCKNLRKGCDFTIPVNVRYRTGGKKALHLNNIKERC